MPIQITASPAPPGLGPVLTWPAVVGECYEIDYSNDLVTWNVLATITASSDPETFTDPNPVASPGFRFYRIKQVVCP